MHLERTFGTMHLEAQSPPVLTSLQHGPTAFYSVDTIAVSVPQKGLWDVSHLNGLVVDMEVLAPYEIQVHPAPRSISLFATDVELPLHRLLRQ